jgi:hypothetical protein
MKRSRITGASGGGPGGAKLLKSLAQFVLHFSAAAFTAFSSTCEAASFVNGVTPFLETHCYECHDADTRKGGLRLDTLKGDLADADTVKTWTHVFDKISSGEMPPPKKPRPVQAELRATTKRLHEELYAASLSAQKKYGRVVVRRLNSSEYEATVRELVGTQVRLKEILPEDDSASGFDTVSAALDLSATHLLLYQEAAEKAVASAVPMSPPVSIEHTRTGREISEKGPNFKSTLTRTCKLVDDSLVIYSRLPRFGLCATPNAPVDGRYRIQMKARAVGGEGRAIPVGYLTFVQGGPEEPVLREVHEIEPGEPKVYAFEFDLARRQPFIVNLLTLSNPVGSKKPIEEYTGLGLQVDWLKIEGPIGAFPPDSYARIFEGVPLKPRSVASAIAAGKKPPVIADQRNEYQWAADPLEPVSEQPKEDADRLMRRFVQRAFRRPVDGERQKYFAQLVHAKLDAGYTFYEAMLFGYKLVLSSADFLFLIAPTGSDARDELPTPQLDAFALAERLSYFLWSSAPDEELLAHALKGDLLQPGVLREQTERLLQSPNAHRFTANFAGQWLDLRKIDATIPDPHLYGDFDHLLLWSMQRETELFFQEVLRNNLPLTDFVHSDWSMLNERLARQYDIAGVPGNAFRKVKLPPDSHRGGVMTQASVLKVTADGTRTSPVLRGKWVLERMIGKPQQPPPPDVPAIEPDIRGATTIRQQLEKHRNLPSCAGCHNQIDPPGFALETFDPIGNWRDFYRVTARPAARTMPVNLQSASQRPVYRGPDVEQGFTMADGRAFKDIDEYKALLLTDKEQLARNLAEKLIVYATGAEIQFADREVVEQITAGMRGKNYGFRSLIHDVIQSRVFRNK